jgi:dynein heavy chain
MKHCRILLIPNDLSELMLSMTLWDELNDKQAEVKAKFQPLDDQFTLLEKYEVEIADDDVTMLNGLADVWNAFLDALAMADSTLKKQKVFYLILTGIFYVVSYCSGCSDNIRI